MDQEYCDMKRWRSHNLDQVHMTNLSQRLGKYAHADA